MRVILLSLSLLMSTLIAHADEGMWTFDNFPAAFVKQKFGAEISPAWLDRVRQATVRLSNCTGSFVSPGGLVLTNHHCVETCLAQNSSKERQLLEAGFVAATRDKEIKCATQIADVLVAMENVTERVLAATRGLDSKAANDARRKTQTELESACEAASKVGPGPTLKCQVVTLYQGGQYFLYKYRRYDDVRLVFAPEAAIGSFGGDPDNFQYPRWCLDMSLLRVYQDGKPLATRDRLRVNFAGPAAGELVLVSGHPGTTDRLLSVEQLKVLRDTELPPSLLRGSELRGRYLQFAKSGPEARRIVQDPLNSLENGLKVRRKLLDALLDDGLFLRKSQEQANLRMRTMLMPAAAELGDPWTDIQNVVGLQRALHLRHTFLEAGAGFNSDLFRYARALLRAADERAKPNTERLREYTDAALPRLQQQLGANVPVYPELEVLTLSFSLERMREWLGPDDPTVRALLGTQSPDSLAKRAVEGSRLGDATERMQLWTGGAAAIGASSDPMLRLAASVDGAARAIRKQYEDQVSAPLQAATERIARARFAVLGTDVYPDATFTLRLNFGTVRAWKEYGVELEPYTRLSRLFERATGAEPFRVPDSWLKLKDQLDMATPFNLATDNDIIGGNSGSPLINARGELVGLIFDGNIHSISGDYWFDTEKNRAIAVHPAIMRVALEKVYPAAHLLAEITAASRPARGSKRSPQ